MLASDCIISVFSPPQSTLPSPPPPNNISLLISQYKNIIWSHQTPFSLSPILAKVHPHPLIIFSQSGASTALRHKDAYDVWRTWGRWTKTILRRSLDGLLILGQRVQDCLPMDIATHLACFVSKSLKRDSHIRSDQLSADHLWSSGKKSSCGICRWSTDMWLGHKIQTDICVTKIK